MRKYLIYLGEIFKRFVKISFTLLVLQIIITGLNIVSPVLLERMIDDGIVSKNIKTIFFYSILSILCLLIINTFKYLFNKFAAYLKTEQSFYLRRKILNNLSKGDFAFFQSNSSGDILKTLESDVSTLEEIGIDWFVTILIEIIGGIFAIRLLFRINYNLLLIVLIAESCIIIIQRKFVSKLSDNAIELRKLGGKSLGFIEEYVTNIIGAIYSKATKYMEMKFVNNERFFMKRLNKQYNTAEANEIISNTIDGLLTITIYLLGGIFVINDKMSYGELIAFSQYIALIVSPVLIIINSFSKIELAVVSLKKVNHLLHMPLTTSGKMNGKNQKELNIEFENVSLGYNENLILKDINMKLKAGYTYAFVGKNGSGKSTIMKAIYRLIEPQNGRIIIGNQNIEDWEIGELRKEIGIVSQDIFILNDTIYNNIVLDNMVSEFELQRILSIVDLEKMISNLEGGFNSIVGEHGLNLSGGEKQKISIARMLLAGTKIMIFDEATSSIDNYAQDKILEQIQKHYKDRLIIVIAHRSRPIEKSDYIFYIENNSIAEEGTLSQLKEKRGRTYELLRADL